MSKKVLLSIVGFLVCLNILAWQEVFSLYGPQYLKVDFLSVGQGDSQFIETPAGHQILIDGGPSSVILDKLGQRMPFWDRTIDVVILSHPEKDHMAGILEVLQRYKVGYFLWTGAIKNDAENKQLADLLKKASSGKSALAALSGQKQTKVVTISAGGKIKAGNVLIDILYPFENLSGREFKNTSNDSGIVAKVTYGKDSFLFTGDIGFTAESQLANSYELANLNADVLKVAHHGSKYSTSELFLENVNPEYAVIEVGKNSYGHPTPEVLQRLEKFGIKVFITQRDGDVEFISDGQNIKIN
jgi:competence protein ComEC